MRAGNSKGFTLIELMVVIVILGILAGFIMPKILSRPEEARRVKARIQIKNFEAALALYKLDTGSYPRTEQGLGALVVQPAGVKRWKEEGYLEKDKVPCDPWGNKYIYISPGVYSRNYDMISYGKDGVSGGEGEDRDINSWEDEESL